jgi:predicted nucleotidyltransferase
MDRRGPATSRPRRSAFGRHAPSQLGPVGCRRRTLDFVTVPGLEVDVERIAEICRRYGVARLDVFGSVSRGAATPDSDVDVLYELAPGARLGWGIEALADELSEALGRPVDLVSRNALHERLRESVLAEARVLYAA